MSKHPIGPWTETIDNTLSTPTQCGRCLIEANPINSWGSGLYVPGTQVPYQMSVNRGSYSKKSGVNNGGGTHLEPSPCETEFRSSGEPVLFDLTLLGNGSYFAPMNGVKLSCLGQIEPVLYNSFDAGFEEQLSIARNKAYLKLARKLSGAIAEGGIITGELKESARTVKHATELIFSKTNNLTQSLSRVYKNIRGGNYAPVVNEVSDAYLEYQFGVKPGISDVSHLIEATAQLGNNPSAYRHLSGTYVLDFSTTDDGFHQYNWPAIYFDRHSYRKTVIIAKMGGTIDMRTPLSEDNPDLERFGLGGNSFAPTVYNLLPYTWLNDYFNNASDFVNAFAFRRGILKLGWSVAVVKTVARHTFTPRTDNYFIIASQEKPVTGTSDNFYFNRSPANIDGFIPDFHVKTPSLGQAANILALAASRASALAIRTFRRNPKLNAEQLEDFVGLINQRIIK